MYNASFWSLAQEEIILAFSDIFWEFFGQKSVAILITRQFVKSPDINIF